MGICKDIILYNLCVFIALICPTKQQDEGFVSQVRQNFQEKLNSQLEQQILSFHNLEFAYRAYAAYFDRADVDLPGFRKFFHNLEERSRASAVSITTYINNRGGRVRFPVVQLKDACNYIEKLHKKQDSSHTAKPFICYYQSQAPDRYKAGKPKDKGGIASYSWPNWWFGKKQTENEKNDDIQKWKSTSGLLGLQDALALEKSINDELMDLAQHAKIQGDPHAKVTTEHFLEHQVETIKKLADLVTRLQQYQQDGDYPLGEYLLDRELVN